MKSFTTSCLIAAAAMFTAAGSAAAEGLKVEIPFSFRAGGAVMAAGTYRVIELKSYARPMLRLAKAEGPPSQVLLSAHRNDAAKAWLAAGVPKLSFDCVSGQCTLAKVWTAREDTAMSIT